IVLGGDTAHERRRPDALAIGWRGGLRAWRRGCLRGNRLGGWLYGRLGSAVGCRRALLGSLHRRFGGRSARRLRRFGCRRLIGRLVVGANDGDWLTDRDGVALGDPRLAQLAAFERFDLNVDLVGLDLRNGLPTLDGVAL